MTLLAEPTVYAPAVAHDLDLSPIVLCDVPTENGSVLRFREPLMLTPTLTESQEYITVEYAPLDIDVVATTRDDLIDALFSDINNVWSEIALREDALLSSAFRIVKKHALAAIKECADDAA